MRLTQLHVSGFKSFAKKTVFDFESPVVAIVGPNGSGKSNVAEAIRFVLGEQSMKSMRGKRGEDLIWNGSTSSPRANRASASLTFDNSSRFLDIDFNEVVVERVVHRDGVNEYRLNGSAVRLKDILGLLAGANIGESGHHIISQGEADKILSASNRERREMLEDALGLKVYQYKKEESIRKLGKTEENMRQVEALRREVQPHLKFLKRQVEKIQKSEDLRKEATERFRRYFAAEQAYLASSAAAFAEKKKDAEARLAKSVADIAAARRALSKASDSSETRNIVSVSERLDAVRGELRSALSSAARLAGELDALERVQPEASIPRESIEAFIKEKEAAIPPEASGIAVMLLFARSVLSGLRELVRGGTEDAKSFDALRSEKATLDTKAATLAEEETRLSAELEAIRSSLDEARTEERAKERELFSLTAAEREVRHELSAVEEHTRSLRLEEEEYKRELGEAGVLIGREAVALDGILASPDAPRDAQAAEKRELQKIKIRLEEMGAGGGEDVAKEYREATEREAFLEKELADLEQSAHSLKELIANLDAELRTRFERGITAINEEFSRFFALMFDGGSAKLVFVQEPVRRVRIIEDADGESPEEDAPGETDQPENGIDLALSIPRKRVKSLTMLSGGERALTSIALIFAMSSVNPPPFLVLDETDAALDEANSRRYGDMVGALSEKSQLVLITHNRETMSRAGILYGVTMGGDGVSKVLSVKLEEAVQVAK